MEGDGRRRFPGLEDNPFLSTPSGWRATARQDRPLPVRCRFLSTPSGWRATWRGATRLSLSQFLSTPSGWRATGLDRHTGAQREFLSTPSGWRATFSFHRLSYFVIISIHALRVEGDRYNADRMGLTTDISIHALRVEGDSTFRQYFNRCPNFYPRPPGGGRLQSITPTRRSRIFLSTPSGWRATRVWRAGFCRCDISIHALRVEGDGKQCQD